MNLYTLITYFTQVHLTQLHNNILKNRTIDEESEEETREEAREETEEEEIEDAITAPDLSIRKSSRTSKTPVWHQDYHISANHVQRVRTTQV